ncbi:MAG: TolC family protein [Ferruginibacter sp.]
MIKLTKRLTLISIFSLIQFLMLNTKKVHAQTIDSVTLNDVNQWARSNYPLIRQLDLLKQTSTLTIDNIQTALKPQVNVNGQASYQSDVTTLPIKLPNVTIDPLSRDQYRFWTDISQLVYDGGVNKSQRNVQSIVLQTELQKTEVELYKLKERMLQLYMGIVLIDGKQTQVRLMINDILRGIKIVEAQVANGVAYKSALATLQAQQLQTEQQLIELASNRASLIQLLSLFTGKNFSSNLYVVIPQINNTTAGSIHRAELTLFKLQDSVLKQQQSLIKAKNLPKASIFVQGGYGKPALNQLKNEFDFYYTTGIRLNWSLSGLYTAAREKHILRLNQQQNTVQQDLFLLKTQSETIQFINDVNKYEQLIASDQKIIALRNTVKEAAAAQLQNNVIVANDYLREVSAEDQARNNLLIHQIQKLQAQLNIIYTEGKL